VFYYYVINLIIHSVLRLTSQYNDLIFTEDECFICDMKSRYYNHEFSVIITHDSLMIMNIV